LVSSILLQLSFTAVFSKLEQCGCSMTTIQFDFAFLVGTFRQIDEGYIVFALKRKMNTFILLRGNTNSRTDKNVKHSRKA